MTSSDYATPENQQLIIAITSGQMLPSIETSLTPGSSLRVPKDLDTELIGK